MKTLSLMLTSAVLISSTAFAGQGHIVTQFTGMHSVVRASKGADKLKISSNVVAAGFGYEYEVNNNFSLTPMVHLGSEIGDAQVKVNNVNAEKAVQASIPYYYSASLRAKVMFSDALFGFAQYDYVNQKTKVKIDDGVGQPQQSDDHHKFGLYSAGLGFKVNDTWSLDAVYGLSSSKDHAHRIGLDITHSF